MSYNQDVKRQQQLHSSSPPRKKQFIINKELSDSDSDNEQSSFHNTPSYASFYTKPNDVAESEKIRQYSSFAQKQMELMGHKAGKGLGKYDQGRADILDTEMRRGRRGLGFQVEGFDDVQIVEQKEAIPSCSHQLLSIQDMQGWCYVDKKKLSIEDETEFCDPDVLSDILSSKSVFDALTGVEFLKARTRANPYEFIKGAIFQNRRPDADFSSQYRNEGKL
ncbi:Cap-specific mRNA (nucleoside-2'-O-)-methyltransferase 1 [Exaiptasia diaphana]|nr:Cap-specific mRNA (nucleoside-2'-O-)-methyltransferase 1 [Exaiptasia diaphana]